MVPPIDVSRFEQLKASGDLPSPKGVALAVMRLTQQDNVAMTELIKLIRSDPAFVGRLIKAANGIIGYGRRPIASIQDALTILGMPAIRNMALGFSLLNNYRDGACEGFDYSGFWASSLLSAVTLQAVTLRTRVAASDETYCLGLLARVGELAIATLYPHDYSLICQEGRGDQARMLDLEAHTFAMTSAELGAAMLSDWGLPRLFADTAYNVAAARPGQHADGSRQAVLEDSLGFARLMGRLCQTPEPRREVLRQDLLRLGSRLHFDETMVVSLTDGAISEWNEWSGLLNLATNACSPFERQDVPAVLADATQDEDIDEPEATAGLRILLAEADVAARAALRQALQAAGYAVAEAGDGFSATELALDFHPDMMLLGWQLPDISALELLSTLRRTRIGRAIYVVLLADNGSEETMLAAFDGGADDILIRPVTVRLLLARLAAGRRLSALHFEVEQDREEIRHFAAQLAVSNRRLQQAALTDSLTGFPNRRFFLERLAREWADTAGNLRPLSCIVLDIDHFKQINDTHGHDVGDRVLQRVSSAIRGGVRPEDMFARIGGDEFVVLCPDSAIGEALACAERIRRAVTAIDMASDYILLTLSISAGVACSEESIHDADTLIKRADQSLYRAKQTGRNRVASVQIESGNT